jgi:hypothetical protein
LLLLLCRLWPVAANGFDDLVKRTQAQAEGLAANRCAVGQPFSPPLLHITLCFSVLKCGCRLQGSVATAVRVCSKPCCFAAWTKLEGSMGCVSVCAAAHCLQRLLEVGRGILSVHIAHWQRAITTFAVSHALYCLVKAAELHLQEHKVAKPLLLLLLCLVFHCCH